MNFTIKKTVEDNWRQWNTIVFDSFQLSSILFWFWKHYRILILLLMFVQDSH